MASGEYLEPQKNLQASSMALRDLPVSNVSYNLTGSTTR
jgi:hypothetical protein